MVNKRFNGQDFTRDLLLEQSPKGVFNAINNVRGWWSKSIKGNTNSLFDEFKVDFKTHWWTFKIIEMVPEEKVVWYVTGSYMPWNKHETEWTDTKVCFEISLHGDKTKLKFTHTGLVPSSTCFTGCSKGWTGYIQQSLRLLITTGSGYPDFPY